MSYQNPTPVELEHLLWICENDKTYIMPSGLTREERIAYMKKCIEDSKKEE